MGLFKLFAGKSPADHERKGDAFAQGGNWGDAKLAFESALEKLGGPSPPDPQMHRRLKEKLHHSREALALAHRLEAEALMEAGCKEDARELLTLALDLTADEQLQTDLAQLIDQTAHRDIPSIHYSAGDLHAQAVEPAADPADQDVEDQFHILLGTLPEEIQQTYLSYGYHFKHGYLALNQGAFHQAVEHLIQAAEANPDPDSLVPLELATAYVNLGQTDNAQSLLEELVRHQTGLLPAFQLLCDIYWSQQAFDKAKELLETLTPELAQSMGAYLLKGETLLQSACNEEAKAFFEDMLKTYGWHEPVALGLARALESLNQVPQARDIYGEMISQCTGCGSRIDPSIKRKFADLSIAAGDHSTKVLEYYLSLSREDPANAVHYCQNISRIYAAQGVETEARRFRSIAEDLARRQQSE